MAGRFGRSMYRFSSVNRPLAPGGNTTSGQDSTQYDRRRYPSVTRDTSVEPQTRSPLLSPRRESLPTSPTYSVKKAPSPPASPSYRAPTTRAINSPPKPVEEYPKYKPTNQPRSPEAEPKSVIHKAIEKVTKSERHVESGKTATSGQKHKQQQPANEINIKGENVGAVMEIVESSKREGGGHIIKKKDHKLAANNNNNNNIIDQNNNNEANSEDQKAALPATTFLNSNFQTVNNCLLYNASLTHRDPGLHVAFSRNQTGGRFSTLDDKKQQHTNKY